MEGFGAVHLLRLIHVLFGAFWAGSAAFNAFFLLPSVRAAGPAGGKVMEQLTQVRRLPVYLMAASILTVLSGVVLYWRDSAGFSSSWMGSGQGVVFGFGGIVGITVAIIGMGFITPTVRRMGELAGTMRTAGDPPSAAKVAEMQALQSKMSTASLAAAVLLVIATGAMAVARYVP